MGLNVLFCPFFVIFVVSTTVLADTNPKEVAIEEHPNYLDTQQYFYVELGSTVNINCTVDISIGGLVLLWYKDIKSNILGSSGISYKQNMKLKLNTNDNGYTLTIPSIKMDDYGKYYCYVAMENAIYREFVVAKDPPKFVVTPTEEKVNVTGMFKLNCKVENLNDLDVMWFKDDKNISKNDIVSEEDFAIEKSEDGYALVKNNVGLQDGGSYYCKVDPSPLEPRMYSVTVEDPNKAEPEPEAELDKNNVGEVSANLSKKPTGSSACLKCIDWLLILVFSISLILNKF